MSKLKLQDKSTKFLTDSIADIFAREADFFSIGTNDLTQYTMSVDRGNPDVAYLYSAFQPPVLRSIKNIIRAGCDAGIPVGMCGEAAADPYMIPLLISFGLTEFSVERCTIFGGSFRYYILYFIQPIILYIGLNNTIGFFKTHYIIIWQFTPTVFS